jgi:hypothetical protein
MLEARRTENGRCIVVPGPKERVSRDLGTTSQTGSMRCNSYAASAAFTAVYRGCSAPPLTLI